MSKGVVMITGATGFIGSHLTERMLADGYEVHAMGRMALDTARNLNRVMHHSKFRYSVGDLLSDEDVDRFWRVDADAVIHLATMAGAAAVNKNPLACLDTAIMGTRNLIGRAARDGVRVVYTSSIEVYGNNPCLPWNEESERVLGPTHTNRWSYASAKAVCEHYLYGMREMEGLPFTIARLFNVYGPRQRPEYIVAHSIHNALNNRPIVIHDGGTATRCFVYIDDAVDALRVLATREEALGEAFHIGDPKEVSVREVAEMVTKLSGSDAGYRNEVTGSAAAAAVNRRSADAKKATRLLGWQARVGMEEGIRDFIAWARKNDEWLGTTTTKPSHLPSIPSFSAAYKEPPSFHQG